MPRRRDRHDRGLRGPIALPNPYTRRSVPLRRGLGRQAFFTECLTEAVARIQGTCPGGLDGVDIGIEEVPPVDQLWTDERIPLAAAIEATTVQAAQIVVYQRPLEHRAASRADLRRLVHRTLAEQLAALTARSVTDIDPDLDDDEW